MCSIPNENLFSEFRSMIIEKAKLESKLDDLSKQIAYMKNRIRDKFEQEGQTTAKLETGETIFIHSQYWAKIVEGKSKPEVIDVLRSIGLDYMVREDYNSNTLSAYIRELKKEKAELPKELAEVITTEPTFDVRVRGVKI